MRPCIKKGLSVDEWIQCKSCHKRVNHRRAGIHVSRAPAILDRKIEEQRQYHQAGFFPQAEDQAKRNPDAILAPYEAVIKKR